MRTTFRLPLLVAAACATAALAACGGDQTGGGAGAATDPTYATNPDTPMDQKPTTAPVDGGNTGGDNGGGNSGDNGGGTTNEQTGPTIVSFRVASKPSCPAGTNVNPIPGQPVKLSWKVSGTDKVTISIDGPGVFQEFPAEHSETFSFGCDGNPGDTAEHTFLLRTVGGGEVEEKTLTVTAKVNEITVVTDEQATRTETELPTEETGTESG
jgi:hypothetical protein